MTKSHHITNGVVQALPGFNKQQTTSTTTCWSCVDKPPAIAHCHDCRENLCETCVGAHRRVSMTKSHHVTNLLLHGVAGPSGATLESKHNDDNLAALISLAKVLANKLPPQ